MKIIFLTLLLANLIVLAYHHWIAPEPAATYPAAAPIQAPQLKLASELPAARTQASGGGTAAGRRDDLIAEVNRCVSIGPFSELSDVAQAMVSLTEAGYEPRQHATDGQIWAGYWVHLPPAETRASAEAALETLKQSGVTDAYRVPSSDQNNIVSLGVFSERERARRRAEEIRRLGFLPEISERHRSGTVYWIDVDLGDRGIIDPSRFFQSQPGRIVRLSVEACEVEEQTTGSNEPPSQ